MPTFGIVSLPGTKAEEEVLDWFYDEKERKKVRTAHQKGSEDNLTAMVLQFGWSDKNAEEILAKRRKKAGAAAGPGRAIRSKEWSE